MTRFADQKYIDEYKEKGIFPKIHDDIFNLVSGTAMRDVTMDLGSCTGLLSVRLAGVMPAVIGLEGNRNYVKRSVEHDRVKIENLYVTAENLAAIEKIIKDNKVRIVVARRVLPEIAETGGIQLVKDMAKMFHAAHVEEIFIEGRKASKNATNPLSDMMKEAKALSEYYQPLMKHKNCLGLVRKHEAL